MRPCIERVAPPPCGEDRLGRRRSEEGVAGHGAPCRRGTQSLQPRGPGLTDHVGLAPAADARRVGFDREPYARRPPPCPPPQGGGELRAGFAGSAGKGVTPHPVAASPRLGLSLRRPLRNEFGAASRRVLALGPGSHSAFAACARESSGWSWRSVSQQRFPGRLQRSEAEWKGIRDPAQDFAKRRLLFLSQRSPSGRGGRAPSPRAFPPRRRSSRCQRAGGAGRQGPAHFSLGCQHTWRPARRFLTKVLRDLSAVGSPHRTLALPEVSAQARSDASGHLRSASSLSAAPP